MKATLVCSPMETPCGLPASYFDFVYSIYAVGWSSDLPATFRMLASCLKPGGVLIFSWDHPILPCIDMQGDSLLFSGNYLEEDLFSFSKGEQPVSLYNWKLSTYINSLADAGFAVEKLVEETDFSALERARAFSSDYYAAEKARRFPLSFVIKARKLP